MSIKKYERRAVLHQAAASKLDKIKLWYMQDMVDLLDHDEEIQLTDDEHQLRETLDKIWGMLTSYNEPMTIRQVRNKIMKWDGVSKDKAYRLVRMAEALHGEVELQQKATLRSIQTQLRKAAITEIMNDEELDNYQKHYLIHLQNIRIEAINHLEDKDVLNMDEILEKLQMPDTEFTTDPEALNDTIDAEHEEVE